MNYQSLELNLVISRKTFFFIQIVGQKNKGFTSLTLYGARVRGSVIKIEFIVLAKEFESSEISPGFAWFLGEK